MINRYSKSDILGIILFILAYYSSIKLKTYAILYLAMLLIVSKYVFLDLRKYKNGSEISGVLRAQIIFWDKIGGKGFGVGLIYYTYILSIVILIGALIISIMPG